MAGSPSQVVADRPIPLAAAFFDPCAERARGLDARMRRRLGESVRYVAAQIGDALEVPAAELAAFLARVEAGPIHPQAFAAYHDLVLAVEAEDRAGAERELADLLAAPSAPDGPRILGLGQLAARDAERTLRHVDSEPEQPLRLRPPSPAAERAGRARIAAALTRLDVGHPALAAELRALLRQVVLAVGSDEPGAWSFDGASSFMLWGAVVLNAEANPTVLGTVQALAHESAHNLLFGLSADGPLVENGDAERFASPLRTDPRPIDGIFHAVFVTARMQQAVAALRAAGALDPGERDEAERALAQNAALFAQGLATLDRHAKLTPLGAAVLAGARAMMQREAW